MNLWPLRMLLAAHFQERVLKLCPLTPSVRMLLATLPGDSREVVSTEDFLKRAVYEVSKARG